MKSDRKTSRLKKSQDGAGGQQRTRLLEAELQRAQEALRRERAYSAALHDTVLGLIKHLDLTKLLQAIVKRAGAIAGTRHGYVYLLEPGGATMRVRVGTGKFRQCVGRRIRPGEGLAGRVWQAGRALVVDDYSTWKERVPDPAYDKIHTTLGLPLKSEDSRVVGVLALAYLHPHQRFRDDHVAFLSRFAELASVALKNAQLYEEKVQAERALRESEERYRSLFEHVPIGLYRTTPDGRVLDVNPAALQIMRVPDRKTALQIYVPDMYVHPKDREIWRRAMGRQGVVENFEYQARCYDGTVIWVRDNARAVKDERGHVLYYEGAIEDVTAQKRAEAIQRALASKILKAQEQERLHIARELHDVLGQILTVLKLDAEWVLHHPEDAVQVREVAHKLCRHIDDAMDVVRDLSQGLRPALLDDLGIEAVLEALAAKLSQQAGFEIHTCIEPLPEAVSSDVATAIYRIAQEALTNVIRHAGARQACVTLRKRGRSIVLRVADDGGGISESLLRNPRSLGLAGMRERAALLGGTLRIRRRPGGGTLVIAQIPLNASKHR